VIYAHVSELRRVTVQAGYTPLHTACHFGQVHAVEYLLRHAASTEAVTKVVPLCLFTASNVSTGEALIYQSITHFIKAHTKTWVGRSRCDWQLVMKARLSYQSLVFLSCWC